jgi:hypothetical protein
MLIADLDEVTLDLEVDGEQVQRTLQKRVIERGAWATVLLQVQKRGRDGGWAAPSLTILRFAKVRGMYKRHASVSFGSASAQLLHQTVESWFADSSSDSADEDLADE